MSTFVFYNPYQIIADPTIALKFFKMFVLTSWKKNPSKVAQNSSNPLFSLTALTVQTAQTEESMFQNVAYWPTVYRTGIRMKAPKIPREFVGTNLKKNVLDFNLSLMPYKDDLSRTLKFTIRCFS